MIRSYRKQLLSSLALAALLIPSLHAARAEDSIELLTGSIRATRLVPQTVEEKPADDPATALGQPLPPVPADGDVAQPVVEPAASKPVSDASVKAAATADVPKPDEVELSALYYYAREKQDARVTAETERLRHKYPDFQLPPDLYSANSKPRVDELPLWRLYEKDDFARIDALVAELKAENPGWEPSDDFRLKVERRKLRVVLTKAYRSRDWVGVISTAGSMNLQKEKDVDLLWMLIDAYREAAMPDALLDVYRAILFRPGKERFPEPVLVTTLQKAARDFEPEEVRSAMSSLWPNPSLITALKPLQDDFIRRDVADFNNRSERQQPIAEKDIQRLRDLVAAKGDIADMSLLGWYFLKLKQPKDAEPYFKRALDQKSTPEFAKGLYLSYAQQKRDADAYALAAAHLKELTDDPEFLMNALSLRFAKPELGPIDPKSVEAYSTTILKTKSADHAEILAWYSYNSMQYPAAEAWFVQSWNWEEEPNRLKGIALTFLREGKRKEFAALRARFGDLYPDMWAEILNARAPQAQALQPVVITSPTTGQPVIVYRQPDAVAAAPAVAPQPMVSPVVYQPDAMPMVQPATMPVVQPAMMQPVVTAQQQPVIVYATAPAVAPAPVYRQAVPEVRVEEAPAPRQVKIDKGPRGGYFAAFKAKRYSECIAIINGMGSVSADVELIRGWCYLGLNRVADARTSFGQALRGEGRVRHDAAYGSALAALRAKLTDDAEAMITAYPLDAEKDREVRAEIYWQRARSAFDHKDFQGTLTALNARIKLVDEPSDLSVLRAWAHYNMGNKPAAKAIFTRLNQAMADPEMMKGLAAIEEVTR